MHKLKSHIMIALFFSLTIPQLVSGQEQEWNPNQHKRLELKSLRLAKGAGLGQNLDWKKAYINKSTGRAPASVLRTRDLAVMSSQTQDILPPAATRGAVKMRAICYDNNGLSYLYQDSGYGDCINNASSGRFLTLQGAGRGLFLGFSL